MISARGLTHTFRRGTDEVTAVDDIDLEVASGEFVGFLGPNGAGKTTTMRILTTLLTPTSGEATIAGCDLRTDGLGVRRRIGYSAQSGGAGPDCLVGEELAHHGRLHAIPKAAAQQRANALLDELDLRCMADRRVDTLSSGQRRRLDIAMALIHDPALIFLDEPTAALDPQSRRNLWEHIAALHDEAGKTVFLTTHYLEEADELCQRVLVIDGGRIVAQGSPTSLKNQVAGDAILLGTPQPEAAAAVLRPIPAITELVTETDGLRLRIPEGRSVLPELLRALDHASIVPTSVEVRPPSLDDVFFHFTGRSLRDPTN